MTGLTFRRVHNNFPTCCQNVSGRVTVILFHEDVTHGAIAGDSDVSCQCLPLTCNQTQVTARLFAWERIPSFTFNTWGFVLLILNKNSLQWILNEVKALTRDLLKADEQLFSFPPFLVEGL